MPQPESENSEKYLVFAKDQVESFNAKPGVINSPNSVVFSTQIPRPELLRE